MKNFTLNYYNGNYAEPISHKQQNLRACSNTPLATVVSPGTCNLLDPDTGFFSQKVTPNPIPSPLTTYNLISNQTTAELHKKLTASKSLEHKQTSYPKQKLTIAKSFAGKRSLAVKLEEIDDNRFTISDLLDKLSSKNISKITTVSSHQSSTKSTNPIEIKFKTSTPSVINPDVLNQVFHTGEGNDFQVDSTSKRILSHISSQLTCSSLRSKSCTTAYNSTSLFRDSNNLSNQTFSDLIPENNKLINPISGFQHLPTQNSVHSETINMQPSQNIKTHQIHVNQTHTSTCSTHNKNPMQACLSSTSACLGNCGTNISHKNSKETNSTAHTPEIPPLHTETNNTSLQLLLPTNSNHTQTVDPTNNDNISLLMNDSIKHVGLNQSKQNNTQKTDQTEKNKIKLHESKSFRLNRKLSSYGKSVLNRRNTLSSFGSSIMGSFKDKHWLWVGFTKKMGLFF